MTDFGPTSRRRGSDQITERAVRIAALGNIVVFSEQGTQTEYRLDAAQFIKDLNDAGWEIVRHA